jgi:hypothetical protein
LFSNFIDYRNQIECYIDSIEKKIKSDIDQRVEILIGQIERARGELHHEVKKECDKLKELVFVFKVKKKLKEF